MNREILILMDGDDTSAQCIRKLVATWPHVLPSEEYEVTIDRWSRVSGVELVLVERYWEQLFASGLCNADGTISPEAASYIKAIAMTVGQSVSRRGNRK